MCRRNRQRYNPHGKGQRKYPICVSPRQIVYSCSMIQVQYLMRGINGENLGLKYLNVVKILMISGLCRVKCKLCLKSKIPG